MLQPAKIAPDGAPRHEEIFLARYGRLRAWGLHLTENDRERAEDLVHDAFIQFTFTRPDLEAIGNLDGYLYTMLRNLHLSQVRRSLRLERRTLSIVDYDSAEIGLRAADTRQQIRLQDELREVCRYASLRKETSKAGSVLILRFLHGYYPREIALVMQGTRAAVEERLRLARNEARQFLLNPKSLRFLRETTAKEAPQSTQTSFAQTTDALLNELRQTIFDSRQGDCLTKSELEKLYQDHADSRITHTTLAHIASCPKCLDEVNRLLDLPSLIERFPTDTLGTDTSSKGGDGGGGGGSAGGDGATESELRRCRKRAKDVLEHRPAELCISVNGYLMAAQKVGSELSEQTLSINVAEKIDFVEIFSEQDVRLLFLAVEEQAQDGTGKRRARVRLSDERTLEATLSFSNPWPTLQVVYSDPLMNEESSAQLNEFGEVRALPATSQLTYAGQAEQQGAGKERSQAKPPNFITRLWRSFTNTGFWLRPGAITAIVSLVLIAALIFVRLHVPAASAAELLRRSTVAEETIAGNREVAVHRTINLEERRAQNGVLLSSHRIEVWQSAAHGVRLRRIYDEQNNLVAGEWTKAGDNTSTVYRRAMEPQQRTAPDVAARAILETGELWRLDSSAKDFNSLVGSAEAISVEEREDAYVLSYRDDSVNGIAGKLMRATLKLNKTDLRAIQQTLTIGRDGEAREYRFIEAGFEEKPSESVAPDVFKPERELLGPATRVKNGADKGAQAAVDSLHPESPVAQPSSAVASPELEIEVTYLLNQIKANLGEQVSMWRTTGGMLHVEALVETEGRKEEILRALGSIIGNPAVDVEVSTVAEAVGKRGAKQSKTQGATTVREVEVADNRIPADPELRAYFSKRLVGSEAIDEEINRYVSRVMNHSRQALLRASALKKLVSRFSPEEMRSLAPEAQTKWLAMIREHAGSYQREVAAVRQELHTIFGGAGDTAGETVTEANLARAAERLVQLSYANDEAVRSAFTISADGRTAAAIKSAQFWRDVLTAEKLAAAIERVYQK
jgi:DNA-directed RNA polymerase specialized sigma24 family protein